MAKVVKCYVCRHPKRKEIDAALKAGESQRGIVRRLCPDLKPHSLQRHFAMDHHLQEIGADWKPGTIHVQTIVTKRTIKGRATKGTKGTTGAIVKVHWELPRDLVKRLKHAAIDREVPTIEVVREILDGAV